MKALPSCNKEMCLEVRQFKVQPRIVKRESLSRAHNRPSSCIKQARRAETGWSRTWTVNRSPRIDQFEGLGFARETARDRTNRIKRPRQTNGEEKQ
jgi:hypothetical protein